MVAGHMEPVQTRPLALPLKVGEKGKPGLTTEQVDEILEWAQSYQGTLK